MNITGGRKVGAQVGKSVYRSVVGLVGKLVNKKEVQGAWYLCLLEQVSMQVGKLVGTKKITFARQLGRQANQYLGNKLPYQGDQVCKVLMSIRWLCI